MERCFSNTDFRRLCSTIGNFYLTDDVSSIIIPIKGICNLQVLVVESDLMMRMSRSVMMMSENLSKRDQNKIEKEHKLLASAFQLFIEKGIENTTVNDIVSKAGLAKGTFYLYFKDKQDIEEKLIIQETVGLLNKAIDAIKARNTESFEEAFLGIVDYVIDYLKADSDLTMFINKNLSYALYTVKQKQGGKNRYRHIYEELFEQYAKQVNYPVLTDPEIVITLCIEFLGATVYSSLVYEMPKPIHELRPHLHNIIKVIFESYRVK